ncbi:hypothetical protein SNEBB_008803, partial [Seison nebaliae]
MFSVVSFIFYLSQINNSIGLSDGIKYISKTPTTVTLVKIVCELRRCSEIPNCFGIYSTNGTVQLLTRINKELFEIKLDLFLDTKHVFILDHLQKFGSHNIFHNNYLLFSQYQFKNKKVFDEYADGFIAGDFNYYIGNEFIHKLSKLWPLCMFVETGYKLFGNSTVEHCGITFGSKKTGYKAKIGPKVSGGFKLNKDLAHCNQGRTHANGSAFLVDDIY